MKNSFFLFIFIFCFSNFCIKAQPIGKLTYRLTKNDEKFGKRVQDEVLYIKGKSSIEFPVKKRLEDLNSPDENKGYVILENKKADFIYKNFSNKSLYFRGLIGRTAYLTTDTLLNFDWKITKERSKILNYNCIKAITRFRGRNYIAWYTEDIALQNGPWKFCGLPGLIIKVTDDKEMFLYQLTSINFKIKFDEKIVSIPEAYAKSKMITYHEYMTRYKKKVNDLDRLSKVIRTGKDGSYGTVSVIQSEEMEKF